MARGVNKVIVIGNLGNDPETKNLPSGSMVTNISVATSEGWKDRETGQMNERTEWHRIVMFNRLAEIAGQYLKKGSKVYIEGSLRTRKWQGQDGTDRYTTEIVANNMQMLDSRGGDNSGFSNNNIGAANSNMNMGGANNNSAVQNQQPQQAAPVSPGGFDSFDDDIPF